MARIQAASSNLRVAVGIDGMDVQMGSEEAVAPVREDEVWIELLSPVETAYALIMQALEAGSALPAGLSVAKSERGTLLLNAKAWSTHLPLKSLSRLQMQHPSPAMFSGDLRFCLRT